MVLVDHMDKIFLVVVLVSLKPGIVDLLGSALASVRVKAVIYVGGSPVAEK